MAGYHLATIKRGVLGELSKVREELEEAFDAQNQGVKIMLLVELSDMIGAIKAVAEKNNATLEDVLKLSNPGSRPQGSLKKILDKLVIAEKEAKDGVKIRTLNALAEIIPPLQAVAKKNGATMEDLIKMQQVTERAFKSGHRK